ncbi:MAG: DUF1850 domain-containing protein [Treponema sp.]|nr:DUF1850 domain-containing protein [Treponema sp.]
MSKKTRILFCVSALCAGLFLFLCLVPSVKCVSISERNNKGNSVCSRKALDGFEIAYTHSVNKGRVHDCFSVQGDELVVEKSRFVSYGAGIPEVQDAPDAVFTVLDDGYQISWQDRRMKSFDMAVGLVANHSIIIGGREIPMQELFPPQTGIRFKVERVPVLRYCLDKLDS